MRGQLYRIELEVEDGHTLIDLIIQNESKLFRSVINPVIHLYGVT